MAVAKNTSRIDAVPQSIPEAASIKDTKLVVPDPVLMQERLPSYLHSPEGSNTPTSKLTKFLVDKGILYTTVVSTAINFLSAPLRPFNVHNKLKEAFNKVSMLATKLHLVTYAFSGIESAIKANNPILLASFAAEGACALLGKVRNLYLMRGIATALDALPAGFEKFISKKYGSNKFKSYGECWQKSCEAFTTMLGDFVKSPLGIFSKNQGHDLVVSSVITTIASVLGLTVNDKFGVLRDFSGTFGDIGMARNKNKKLKFAGIGYFSGSMSDFIARLFSKDIAGKFISPSLSSIFENIRDGFHEFSIGLDRIGQYYFIRYNQELAKEGRTDEKQTKLDDALEEVAVV